MPENRDIRVCEAVNTPGGVFERKKRSCASKMKGPRPRQVLLEVKDLEVTLRLRPQGLQGREPCQL